VSTDGLALLVGTQKGLFIATRHNAGWQLDGPHIAGYEVIHTCAPPGEAGVYYAAASHKIWGAHVYRSEDAAAPGPPSRPPRSTPRVRSAPR
jgi:hypothetical protein